MFPMKSWSKHGGKSGKAGNTSSSFLGRECSRTLVRAIGVTRLEIASALARLLQIKQLDSRAWAKPDKLAKILADSWSVIQPSGALRAISIQLVDRFDWRAADSFQLPAALEWCEYAPQVASF